MILACNIFVLWKWLYGWFVFYELVLDIVLGSSSHRRLKLISFFTFKRKVIAIILFSNLSVIISLRWVLFWDRFLIVWVWEIAAVMAFVLDHLVQLFNIFFDAIDLLNQIVRIMILVVAIVWMHRLQSQFNYLLDGRVMVGFRNFAQKSRKLRNLTDNLLHNIISKH